MNMMIVEASITKDLVVSVVLISYISRLISAIALRPLYTTVVYKHERKKKKGKENPGNPRDYLIRPNRSCHLFLTTIFIPAHKVARPFEPSIEKEKPQNIQQG